MDEEFARYATQLLDRAAELRLGAFLEFARLASRFFPPFFASAGFSGSEAERMTEQAIARIETGLGEYVSEGRRDVRLWLSTHLHAVVREAVDVLKKADRELGEAAIRQTEMLSLPLAGGVEASAGFRAARIVSGDFYDAVPCSDGGVILAVGDASGKGGAAAFYSMLALGLLRAWAPDASEPVALMRRINQELLIRKGSEAYLALTLARWDPEKRVLTLANAAGCAPIVVTRKGAAFVQLTGNWLGCFSEIEVDSARLTMATGDVIVIYSDGIADQCGEGQEDQALYTPERLLSTLHESWGRPAQEIAAKTVDDIDAFRGTAPLTDDQTILATRFN